jgi:hypothetical protein
MPGRLSALEGDCPQPSAPSEQFNRRRNGARSNPSSPFCRTMPDRMDQIGSIVHVDDGDNASCFGQKDWLVLFQETNRWHEEHCHILSSRPVASPVNVGGQIDYGDYG